MKIKNVSGEIIPAWSFAHITDKIDGVYQINKPNADSLSAALLCIIPTALPIDANGEGTKPEDGKVSITYNGTIPSNGDDFGTVSGQWYGEQGKTGFKVLSASGGYASISPFSSAQPKATLLSAQTDYRVDDISGFVIDSVSEWVDIDETTLTANDSYIALKDGGFLYVSWFTDIQTIGVTIELGLDDVVVGRTEGLYSASQLNNQYINGNYKISAGGNPRLGRILVAGVGDSFNQIRASFSGDGTSTVGTLSLTAISGVWLLPDESQYYRVGMFH